MQCRYRKPSKPPDARISEKSRVGGLRGTRRRISARLRLLARARVSTAIGVSIRPGRITLARTPNAAFWMATCWVKAISAALVAL